MLFNQLMDLIFTILVNSTVILVLLHYLEKSFFKKTIFMPSAVKRVAVF